MGSPTESHEPPAIAAAAAVSNTAAAEAINTEIAHSGDLTTAQCSASETEVQHDQDVEKGKGGAVTEEQDPNIVFWDGDDDPQNPYNWPTWVKVFNCVLISALTFVTPLASSMFAPGVPTLMQDFHTSSPLLGSFCVSVYVLGFAAGPMIFAPMSEVYGRLWIYNCANLCFFIFLIACAVAPSMNALIVFRFFSGVFGSAPLTNGGGTIADMILQEHRGAAMASFAIGPLLGPIIGPVIGGVVTSSAGWRWVFWIIAIICGVISILFLFFARETYAPTLLQKKVNRLRKETGNPNLRSKLDTGLSAQEHFSRAILRPMKLLVLSPICAICNLYVGIVYAYLYLMFTSLTPLFEQVYNFDTVHAGLTFLGLGVGSMAGVVYFSASSDKYMKKKAAEEKAALVASGQADSEQDLSSLPMKPEYRLAPLRIGAILLPAGFFIYGWTAYYKTHWIAPIIGTAIIGVGNLIVFMSLQLYLVDVFTTFAASALAANAVVRSVAGAVLPLAGLPMYEKLGLGWGNSLLAFIAVALIPIPWLFMKHGAYLRKRFEIKNL